MPIIQNILLASNLQGILIILISFLQVLSLEWSSGMENLRCVSRVDITLTGSFADMILLSSAGATVGNHKADLFVLTSPGQLHFYDNASLTTLLSQQEKKPSVCPVEFPGVIPISDPIMTVAEFMLLPFGGHSSKGLSEVLISFMLK